MHQWGDKDSQGRDICSRVEEVSDYIGEWLRLWGRMYVGQCKEKFGTVRIYCFFGWGDLGSITHPGSAYRPKWVCRWSWVQYLDWIVIPIQKILYCYRYKQAVKKWPDLKEEILCCADWPEYLRGL